MFVFLAILSVIVTHLSILTFFAKQSNRWPSVKGKLLSYKIEKRKFVSKFPSLQPDTIAGVLKVKYEYFVNHKKYVGTRIVFINEYIKSMDELLIDELYIKLKNCDFNVYYSERFPFVSALKNDFDDVQANVFAICLIIAAGIFAYFAYVVIFPHLQMPMPK